MSDQPVEPSSGRIASTGTFSFSSAFTLACQVVPITESPVVNDWMCLRKSAQYSPMFARWVLSTSTAASSWSWSSA